MHRPFAAAIANSVSTCVFYHLETSKVLMQIGENNMTDAYAGLNIEVVTAFIKAYLYFEIYGGFSHRTMYAILRTCLASILCTLVSSPINVYRSRVQVEANVPEFARGNFTYHTIIESVFYGLMKNIPCSVVKYQVYERLLSCLGASLLSGLICGFIASLVTYIVCAPLDYLYISRICGINPTIDNVFCGIKYGGLHSALGSGLAHAILEFLTKI